MRTFARPLRTYLFGNYARNHRLRQISFFKSKEALSVEEEAERKVGWLLKIFFLGTVSYASYHFLPYMGDNLLQQSVKLLQVKDPLFKRMGASRLSRFAINDEKRMKILELGGAEELLNMLNGAKDDKTRKEALKALASLCQSDAAVGVLHRADAFFVIDSTPDPVEEDKDFMNYKTSILHRFRDLNYEPASLVADVQT